MPRDGGHLILNREEKAALVRDHPEAAKFIKRFVGSEDMIRGNVRYCIWANGAEVEASAIPPLRERFQAVALERSKSPAESTRQFAAKSHRFVQIQGVADKSVFIVPRVSSERRRYLPIDVADESTIVSDSAFAVYDAPLWSFSIIASRMHLVWVAAVCGKLKSDFRYSNTIGWNAFPLPKLLKEDKARLERAARNILVAREGHYPKTIADLYDDQAMPDDLRAAHTENDELLERAYGGKRFMNDTERLNVLLSLYKA
jgi:hypothetical protein